MESALTAIAVIGTSLFGGGVIWSIVHLIVAGTPEWVHSLGIGKIFGRSRRQKALLEYVDWKRSLRGVALSEDSWNGRFLDRAVREYRENPRKCLREMRQDKELRGDISWVRDNDLSSMQTYIRKLEQDTRVAENS